MNKVVAIVVTYKRKELLSQVLNSLLMQTEVPSYILVIDNNSNDGTEETVKSIAEKNSCVIYHNTGANLGGAGGFHYGFNVAKNYDYSHLWLMDDDFKPEQDCLEKMLVLDHVGIIQPIRFNLDRSCAELSPTIYDLSNPFLLRPKKQTILDLYTQNKLTSLQNLEGIPFEGPLISKQVVEKIGLPDPKFFIFYDDLDYAIRARKAGFKIICDPSIKAIRLLMNNQKNDLSSWKGYFMLRNFFYIHRLHGENYLVKIKPYILTIGYGFVSLLKGNIKQAKLVHQALKDSKNLTNTDKHKP